MGKVTGISWTDHTFNPWWGCTKVSAGCDNCYAEAFDKRVGGEHWGKGVDRRVFSEGHWREPLNWNAAAWAEGRKHLVFCASMADVMDDEAPSGERERLWELIDDTPFLVWQLLTKRPQRYERYLPHVFRYGNVWLGVTAEDQDNYDLRWPILQSVARSRSLTAWISYEPAIAPLTMRKFILKPDWIIFGGESGPRRRPCKSLWAQELLEECKDSGVAFFVKQMGGLTPIAGAEAIPDKLRVRQFPKVLA